MNAACAPIHCNSEQALRAVVKAALVAAVDQILDHDYPQVLRDLDVPILLAAVTYDAKTKEHACRIAEA